MYMIEWENMSLERRSLDVSLSLGHTKTTAHCFKFHDISAWLSQSFTEFCSVNSLTATADNTQLVYNFQFRLKKNKFRKRRRRRNSLQLREKHNWRSIMDTGNRKYLPNPRDTAGILSVIFYVWTLPLFRKGYEKILELSDVFHPRRGDRSETLGQRLEQ